jgi:hypothetical protein
MLGSVSNQSKDYVSIVIIRIVPNYKLGAEFRFAVYYQNSIIILMAMNSELSAAQSDTTSSVWPRLLVYSYCLRYFPLIYLSLACPFV